MRALVHEPAKQSRKAAKLDLLTLEPGVQPTVGDRGRCIAAIKRVCLVDDGVVARMLRRRVAGLWLAVSWTGLDCATSFVSPCLK